MHCARTRRLVSMLVALILACGLSAAVWSYGEENLPFVDPADGSVYSDTLVSSIHFDLSYALAICAGFTEADAREIQRTTQMSDVPLLGPYRLEGGALPTPPPAAAVCQGAPALTLTFPVTRNLECPGCFTSRWDAFSPFFHFPHDTAAELGQLRGWAYGEVPQLVAMAVYAYDEEPLSDVLDAECYYTPTLAIDTGAIAPGSLAAFGIYLHGLGDAWSHRDCIAEIDARGGPWGTHTNQLPACAFTAHAREFGTGSPDDAARTLDGIHALYDALKARSQLREGAFVPVEESAMGGWLARQLDTFVHEWGYLMPQPRRALAAQIADRCAQVRMPRNDCADFDGSGTVDAADVQAVAGRWGTFPVAAEDEGYDRDGDGRINIVDISFVSAAWGTSCQPVPLRGWPLP